MVVLKSLPKSTASGWRVTGDKLAANHNRCWLRVAVDLLLSGLILAGSAWAAEFDEYAVKAAYLYNFAKFVEWPPETFADADAPLRVCIAGDNPFGGALATLSDKTVGSHRVEVLLVPATTGFDQCHIVFISRAEQGRFKALLAKLGRLPILTISDIGLKLSSQLLKLATIVN